MKSLGHIDEQKEKRPEAENGENVRRIDDESVRRYAEYCRYRIDGKDEVSHVNDYQNKQQQRSRPLAVDLYKEILAVVMLGNTNEFRCQVYDRALSRVKRLV